ncbi:hypothetical protein [Clostridium tyrobutyricum]|uniref:hypothetical protein n=2 Tax=Clostridium tyrobutyricum TaxID=1519 RepID=UPI00057FBCC4|nr:hypothetical protein [Clostridium tyrobutyricum]MBV4439403.1 hypothetical protein [Clostridium tyrobutyricum]
MAEYTLGQVIDKLGRNPNLQFRFIGGNAYKVDYGTIIHLDPDGYVVDRLGISTLSRFNLNSKFTLVNEPVDKMEALKAFDEGKVIYCDCEGQKYHYDPSSMYGDRLVDTHGNSISVQEILYGKWFIEEGEK